MAEATAKGISTSATVRDMEMHIWNFQASSKLKSCKRISLKYFKISKPKQEMNILILGETGVGKSTWINAVANYLSFPTLKIAEKGKLMSLIPTSFTLIDDDNKKVKVTVGADENEQFEEEGQSATQEPRAYILHLDEMTIRLIDTPGIGDTRGIEKDKENLESILRYLTNLDKLNGICILLKSNAPRLTVNFKFCLQELLKHLHKDASKNIVFCYTYARNSNYEPGEALPILKKLLQQLKGNEIKIQHDTMYFVDNESFRFLCAKHNGVKFDDLLLKDSERSWKKSYDEVSRMIKHFKSIKPHEVTEMISVNEARRIIIELQKPIADILMVIQENIMTWKAMNRFKQAFKESFVAEMKDDCLLPVITYDTKKLDCPRTVCTSNKCVDYKNISDTEGCAIINFKHCHDPCFEAVDLDLDPRRQVKKCKMMSGVMFKTCKACGCAWDKHMNISFETVKNRKYIVNPDFDDAINFANSLNEQMDFRVRALEQKIRAYAEEEKVIVDVIAKFGYFLKTNAIISINDGFEDYVKYQIRLLEEKCGPNTQVVDRLKSVLNEYHKEVDALEDAMNNNVESTESTTNIVSTLTEKLFKLPVYGETLRGVVESTRIIKTEILITKEHHFNPRVRSFSFSSGESADLVTTMKNLRHSVQ